MKMLTWSSETFPRLTERQFDLLCAAQDAGGEVTAADLIESADITGFIESVPNELHSMVNESLLSRRTVGRLEFFSITSIGDAYLNSPPPEGVQV